MIVEEYLKPDGTSPYEKWFALLDVQAAARVTTAKARMEAGNTSNIKWFDGIGEYVIHWGSGYRIYLLRDGDQLIVLLGGGSKSGQQADIDAAKILADEYKSRKRALLKARQHRATGKSR